MKKINPTSDINATKSNRTGRKRGKERKGREKNENKPQKKLRDYDPRKEHLGGGTGKSSHYRVQTVCPSEASQQMGPGRERRLLSLV